MLYEGASLGMADKNSNPVIDLVRQDDTEGSLARPIESKVRCSRCGSIVENRQFSDHIFSCKRIEVPTIPSEVQMDPWLLSFRRSSQRVTISSSILGMFKKPSPIQDQLTCVKDLAKSCGNSNSSETSCAICLEKYKPSGKIRKLPCGHCFHRRCCARWVRKRSCCPLCRAFFSH